MEGIRLSSSSNLILELTSKQDPKELQYRSNLGLTSFPTIGCFHHYHRIQNPDNVPNNDKDRSQKVVATNESNENNTCYSQEVNNHREEHKNCHELENTNNYIRCENISQYSYQNTHIIDTHDDDDDSLESLEEYIDDNKSSQKFSTSPNIQKVQVSSVDSLDQELLLFEQSILETIRLLERFIPSSVSSQNISTGTSTDIYNPLSIQQHQTNILDDPTSILINYYQVQHKLSNQQLKNCFTEQSTQYDRTKPANWNVSFTCPITNICVASSLPFSLWIMDSINNEGSSNENIEYTKECKEIFCKYNDAIEKNPSLRQSVDHLEEVMKLAMGCTSWTIAEDGLVYFSSKKSAKKCCAIFSIFCLTTLHSSSTNGHASLNESGISRNNNKARYILDEICNAHDNTKKIYPTQLFASTIEMAIHKYKEYISLSSISMIETRTTPKETTENDRIDELNEIVPSTLSNKQNVNSKRKQQYYRSYKQNPKTFPEWVNSLYEMGVSQIEISYSAGYNDNGYTCNHTPPVSPTNVESAEMKAIVSNFNTWQPTKVQCTIVVKSPFKVTIQSSPRATKDDAKLHAIKSLRKYVAQRSAELPSFRETLHKSVYRDNEKNEIKQRKQLLQENDSIVTTCHFPHPTWATTPFEPLVPNDDSEVRHSTSSPSTFYYLYELLIQNDSHNSLFSVNSIEIDLSAATRVGILFSEDIDPYHTSQSTSPSTFTSHFSLAVDNDGSKGTVTARLIKRTKLDGTEDFPNNVQDPITTVKVFNQHLIRWKEYGIKIDSKRFTRTSAIDFDETQRESFGRTYLFVPLVDTDHHEGTGFDANNDSKNLQIDWEIIQKEVNSTATKLLPTPYCQYTVPILGIVDAPVGATIFILLAISVCPFPPIIIVQDFLLLGLTIALTCIGILILLLPWIIQARQVFSLNQLMNRYILHRGILYITKAQNGNNKLNALSAFPKTDSSGDSPLKLRQDYTTYQDFFYRRHALKIHYPKQSLIEAILVDKHSDYGTEESYVHLIPEFCYVLPIPRNFMQMMSIVDKIMPHLERQISIKILTGALVQQHLPANLRCTDLSDLISSLAPVVDESSQIYPKPTYQRLEFLGDTILSYYLSINLVSHNANLRWNADDIGEIIAEPAKNIALVHPSFRLGLPRLMLATRSIWRSAYRHSSGNNGNMKCDTCEVNDKSLSDVFESFLAAVFLSTDDDTLLVNLLNNAKLALPLPDDKDGWFSSQNSCIKQGYPFNNDAYWTDQLLCLNDLISNDVTLKRRLDHAASTVQEIIRPSSIIANDDVINSEYSRLLLYCALYHQQFPSDDENGNPIIDPPNAGVLRMRDLLYHVGVWSLKFCLAREAYTRFPSGTPTDLHLIVAVAHADDVIAYIMIKSMLYQSFYGYNEQSYNNIEQDIVIADIRGREVWSRCGGWILGIDEFTKRSKSGDKYPQYPGLCGGRFFGHQDKLPIELTREVVVSFKALFGAFVLSIGVENTWHYCFRRYFDELLLLSPDELRKLYQRMSTLVRSY